ncbi:MAG: imidazoleglycerol-phosphate dehydratase HisB [Desulfobacterales bacterium]|nr:imidazoleglycerol-phosphate dehydratase HisB [Desulfobacterales bacterium]MDD4071810.1 imidazoleglycerol-phosphate dehydratase HisB [Desulfobacterales bacterium]MDD4393392.1 imidazoleglycerol-phosphate dehydratase HisB [Desulfobacterales bacterium]
MRNAEVERRTKETQIRIKLELDGRGTYDVSTGIGFLDHMLALFSVHGFFDLSVIAKGDINVDCHHTVEDVGLVLGDALSSALGDRKGISRYGHAVTPMDDALSSVTIDLSNRPYLVLNAPLISGQQDTMGIYLVKEFFRAVSNRAGMNLHINVRYGENLHHIVESVFKGFGRALDQATALDSRITGVRSSKGAL